jgi:hypothetical protein
MQIAFGMNDRLLDRVDKSFSSFYQLKNIQYGVQPGTGELSDWLAVGSVPTGRPDHPVGNRLPYER